eukprot:CAMPEP_0117501922 /NCGR_PEP_ID=MMETSP0784-20121206/23550_1 /TAXON_ID=39447 /ORGANISM="" /LENGTH=285 /DNA_ID=CAMNT_0005297195 /DNA_START=109 /DNA_END=966 /DNA_ORIENTATION=+
MPRKSAMRTRRAECDVTAVEKPAASSTAPLEFGPAKPASGTEAAASESRLLAPPATSVAPCALLTQGTSLVAGLRTEPGAVLNAPLCKGRARSLSVDAISWKQLLSPALDVDCGELALQSELGVVGCKGAVTDGDGLETERSMGVCMDPGAKLSDAAVPHAFWGKGCGHPVTDFVKLSAFDATAGGPLTPLSSARRFSAFDTSSNMEMLTVVRRLLRENERLRRANDAAEERISELVEEQHRFLGEGVFDLVNAMHGSGGSRQVDRGGRGTKERVTSCHNLLNFI